ncbi:hypothetical protein [Bartonella sp. DGB2]|uniref:hypothetical protein n=1 Tax=Bartonella sp. DGB2 TaxID=3388426 RepID=UPI00398FBF39
MIRTLGGARAVASLLGIHRTRVYAWMRPVENGGTGGRVPIRHIPILLNEAKKMGIDITADDFLDFAHLKSPRTHHCASPSCGTSDLPQDAARAQSNPRVGAGGNHNNYSVYT